jgi:hypothetical protein
MLAKTKKIIKKVAIFGDAEAKKTDQHFKDAFNTAKLLVENGYIIVDGGGPGVMLAATLGAKEAGGRVETVIVEQKNRPNNYEGSDRQNIKLADKVMKMADYPNRLNKLIETADAFVIFKGGVGTLSEVGMTWEMARFQYGRHNPLIFFGEEWMEVIKGLVEEMKFDPIEKKVYEIVLTPEEVLKTIENRKGDGAEEREGWLTGILKKIGF